MKSYWKNMYGYRLGVDETDEPKVYYNVSFFNGLTLTYPEWTVRLSNPRPVPRTDPQPILDNFVKDLLTFNKIVLGLQFHLEPVPLVPQVTGVTPSYGQEEDAALCSQVGWPAPSVPYRKEEQQGEKLHSKVWRTESISPVVEQQVKTEVRTQDSGYSTSSGNPSVISSNNNLPMTANRMKPSFMMNIASKDKKNQLKPYHHPVKTKLTRKMKPNYDPFAFANNPEIRASLAKPQAKAEAPRTLSQKIAGELNAKKEKKSNKSDEDIMTF